MKTYSEIEVEEIVKNAVSIAIGATLSYFREQTVIVDMTTKEEIPNSEIDHIPNFIPAKEYIWGKLKEKGFRFYNV